MSKFSRQSGINVALIIAASLVGGFLWWRATGKLDQDFTPPAEAKVYKAGKALSREIRTTNGVKHAIPLSRVRAYLPNNVSLSSLNTPEFEEADIANDYIYNHSWGIGVFRGNEARFYPYQILAWHEVVNDTFRDQKISVAYSPLSGSGAAFERIVDGAETTFSSSGKWFGAETLIQDKASKSLWSPFWGQAVVGEKTGEALKFIPFETMLFGEWIEKYPDSWILSLDDEAQPQYRRLPYDLSDDQNGLLFPLERVDKRLPSKTRVLGVSIGEGAKAWELSALEKDTAYNDRVGGIPLVVLNNSSDGIRVFDRRIKGQELTLESAGVGRWKDKETSTIWDANGVGIEGVLAGLRLARIPAITAFWVAWAESHPQAAVYIH